MIIFDTVGNLLKATNTNPQEARHVWPHAPCWVQQCRCMLYHVPSRLAHS